MNRKLSPAASENMYQTICKINKCLEGGTLRLGKYPISP